jgi:hypothetical protein
MGYVNPKVQTQYCSGLDISTLCLFDSIFTPGSGRSKLEFKSTSTNQHGYRSHTRLLANGLGNGACTGWGGWFSKFLAEISSHGFVVIANGNPDSDSIIQMTKGTDIPDAIDWVYKNAGTGEYAHIDKTRLAVAGQSCGGIQAYSASLDPRVTLLGIFNSGLIVENNTYLFDKLHTPVGYFLGGPTDIVCITPHQALNWGIFPLSQVLDSSHLVRIIV